MRPFLRFSAAIVAALAVGLVPLVASAAVTLVNLRVDPQANGGAIVTAQFAGPAPAFHVTGAGTAETSVLLDDVTLGPQTPPTIAGTGPISSISTGANGTTASLAIHLTGPGAAVTVSKRSNAIVIVVPPVPGGKNAPGDDSGAGTPAPAASTGLGTVTEMVPLKYADVSEIAGILVSGSNVTPNDNFTPVATNIGTGSLGGAVGGSSFGGFQQSVAQPQTFGGFAGQQQGLGQRLNDNIAIDRRLNAIILTGTREIVDQYKAAIAKIDQPLQSVILETQIVELSDSASRDIGFDFFPGGGATLVNGSNGTSGSSTTGSTSNGYFVHTGEVASGGLSLQANLNAQITLGNGKVLAKPRILAQSGTPASIVTGEALPIFTSVVVAGGTALTSQQVNYVNVGVSLQIQPRISDDGYVTSHIYSEVSSVTSYVSGVPQISQRTANTTATVRDGESFVIGGLLQDNEIKSLTKLPFIGDLPLIGVFFRHYTSSRQQTNLYIVVTPHIVGKAGSPPPATQVIIQPNQSQSGLPTGVPVVPPSPSASQLPQPGAPPPQPTPHP